MIAHPLIDNQRADIQQMRVAEKQQAMLLQLLDYTG